MWMTVCEIPSNNFSSWTVNPITHYLSFFKIPVSKINKKNFYERKSRTLNSNETIKSRPFKVFQMILIKKYCLNARAQNKHEKMFNGQLVRNLIKKNIMACSFEWKMCTEDVKKIICGSLTWSETFKIVNYDYPKAHPSVLYFPMMEIYFSTFKFATTQKMRDAST